MPSSARPQHVSTSPSAASSCDRSAVIGAPGADVDTGVGAVRHADLAADSPSLIYRALRAAAAPIVRWWGRLQVDGQDLLAAAGPTVLMANHDSAWDPVIIAVAARPRQVRALAKSELWDLAPMGWLLDRIGQIPIERGRAGPAALHNAATQLRLGACIGVFPEGTVSRGRALPALSGAARLALAVPDTRIICVSLSGAVDIVRFPRRPRIRVEFFQPPPVPPDTEDNAVRLTRRAMAEVRHHAPYAVPGRTKKAITFQRLADDYAARRTPR